MQRRSSRGHVLSDLHLLSKRARTSYCTSVVRRTARDSDFLVLNGDIFDFAWSPLSIEISLEWAWRWLSELLNAAPGCRVHVMLGNHDCIPAYREMLAVLAAKHDHLEWAAEHLRIGRSLFLHGDVAGRRMDAAALAAHRARWARRRPHPTWLGNGYAWAGDLGLDRAVQRAWFPPSTVARRVHHHLQSLDPGVLAGIEDIYTGHTHLAFRDEALAGLRFHNTGSGVRGGTLKVMRVRTGEAPT